MGNLRWAVLGVTCVFLGIVSLSSEFSPFLHSLTTLAHVSSELAAEQSSAPPAPSLHSKPSAATATTVKTVSGGGDVTTGQLAKATAPYDAHPHLQKTCGKLNATLWRPADYLPVDCASYKDAPRRANRIPKIYYCIMFGLELDMLDVVLAEIYPIVDVIVLTESTVTHSKQEKTLLWEKHKHRYARYLDKIRHGVFEPRRRYSSGWDIEKRQRMLVLRYLDGIRPGDIVMGNVDLDELVTRHTLMRWKYCAVKKLKMEVVHFRYNLNCVQESTYTIYWKTTYYHKSKGNDGPIDLYNRRKMRANGNFSQLNPQSFPEIVQGGSGVWHMTAFGGVEAVVKKYENSPHRFVGEYSRTQIQEAIDGCIYNNVTRFRITQHKDALPTLVRDNVCRYKALGWLTNVQS